VAHPHWTAATLAERLADERHRLDELSHGDVGVRPLLALVHESLSPRARELFRLLSVLEMPGFSALTGAALLDTDLGEAARILDELADARLMEAASGAGELACYRFHELTRIYAREQMALQPPQSGTRAIERVLGCLLAMANEAHLRVYGGDYTVLHGVSPPWDGAARHFDRMLREPMVWFDAERANLRAAVLQAAELGMDEFCWELAIVSVALYEARGLFDEWRSTHLVALEAVTRAGNKRGQGAVLASLGSLGIGHHSERDGAMLLDALTLFEEVGDVLGQALALRTMAHLDRIQGRPERAVERYERALAGFRAADDRAAQTHVLSGLARAYLDMGVLDRAESLVKDALLLGQQLHNRRLQAQALYRMGEVLLTGSQLLAAKAVFQESLQLTRTLGDRVGEAYALSGLGSAALEAGDLPSAEIYFTQVMEICQTAPERNIKASALLGLARVHAERGEHVRAEHYYVQAANSFAAQENGPWRSRALEALYAMRQASERLPMPGKD
jgi:tetratricopeptide (TPR) repeat protein